MSEQRDLYEVLGVDRGADREAIRKAYRKLARQSHPDLNPGDTAAEERFKEISLAWEVLQDEQRRRDYDEFGHISLESGFDAEEARRARQAFGSRFGFGSPHEGGSAGFEGDFRFGGIDDLLGRMFGAGEAGLRLRGADLETHLELDFLEAMRGGEKRLTLARPDPAGGATSETLRVRIPPGVSDGGQLRLAGKGGPGTGGGPPGDLHVRLRVRPHRVFRRDGRDLLIDLPIHVREAIEGARIDVPTLDGRATLSVPPGTQSGTHLRMRGKGVPAAGGRPAGDLLVRVQVRVPTSLDEDARRSLEALVPFEDPEIRKELFS